MKAPNKHDWHRIPNGFTACPICGLKLCSKRAGQHRAVAEYENLNALWILRKRTNTGWQYTPSGGKAPKLSKAVSLQKELAQKIKVAQIPQPRTVNMIYDAAILFSKGIQKKEIAKRFNISERYLQLALERYGGIWKDAMQKVMEEIVAKVRADAGSNAAVIDVDRHFELAKRAEKWLKTKGEELFSGNGEMTITRFYYDHYQPQFLFEGCESAKKLYEIVFRKWRLITGDPPIKDITCEMLAKFRDALMQMKGLKGKKASPNTVRCQMRHIQALLDKCGPPGPRNREAMGFIEKVPSARPPRKEFSIPRAMSEEQITALYEAANAMTIPQVPGISTPDWWQALLVFAWNTGLRRGSIFSAKIEHIDWQRNRIELPSSCMKSKRPLIVHLNETVMKYLTRIRTDREMLFPWPYCDEWFSKTFKKLQKLAGLPDSEYYGLHTIRKALASQLWEVSPGAASAVLGHTSQGITRNHYVNSVGISARALDALSQPNIFIMGGKQ